jgi:hypothetical protein
VIDDLALELGLLIVQVLDRGVSRNDRRALVAELRLEIVLCTMDPKNKRRLEKQLNAQAGGNINTYLMRDAIRELQSSGELQIEDSLVYPPDGKRLYRVELGRYCDDFDEFKNKIYREIRFTEVKMYKREDLV